MTHANGKNESENPKCNHPNLNPLSDSVRRSHPHGNSAGGTGRGLSNMPKRLTETNKWKDAWFLDLSIEGKVLFQYLCDNCDMAGFYQRHDRTISALTGIPLENIPNLVIDLSKSVLLKEGFFWVVNFLEHQKNLPLNHLNNAHLSAIRSLVEHGDIFEDLYLEFIGVSLEDLKDNLGASQGLVSPIGKGKGKDNSKDRIVNESNFEEIWALYPNKDGKKSALKHFLTSVETEQDFKDLKTAVNNYLSSERVKNGYVKNGSTFFNNWRDWINFKEERKETDAERDARLLAKYKK